MSDIDEFKVLTETERDGISGHWFHNVQDPKEREKIRDLLTHNTKLFDIQRRIVEGLYRTAHSHEENFGSPEWALVMARQQGYKAALRDIYKLLPKTKGEKT